MAASKATSTRRCVRGVALYLAIVGFIGLSTVACESGRSTDGSAVASTTPADERIEYKLAVVDRGGYVAPDDLVVARFRSLLEQLSTKWRDTPQRLAEMSVKGRNLLRDKGVAESILNIMEGMNQVLVRPIP